MKKKVRIIALPKAPDGGIIKKKVPFDSGAEMMSSGKTPMIYDNNRLPTDIAKSVGTKMGIDPSLLFSSAWQEGMNKAVLKPDDVSNGYADNQKNLSDYPVDGFLNYGVDRIGDNYDKLKKYLPAGFDQNMKFYKTTNEKNEPITTAAFKTNDAALTGKAAFMRYEQDNINNYAKSKNIPLDNNAQNYFMLASYNGGFGNAKQMIDEYGNTPDKNKFINEGMTSKKAIHKNIKVRLDNVPRADNLINGNLYPGIGGQDDRYSVSPQVSTPSDVPQFAKLGGKIGQKNYALDRQEVLPTLGGGEENTSLNKFIKKVPREEANVEAEKGETVLMTDPNDNSLIHMNIGGNLHSAGGTPLNVPNEAFIFSDTQKMKIGGPILEMFGKKADTTKKFTPADLAKQYDLNKFKDKQKNESDDKFAVDTAELMYANHEKKLGKLAFVQESMKGFPSGIPGVTTQIEQDTQEQPQMRYGGNTLPKAEFGFNDPLNDPFNYPPDKKGRHYSDTNPSINPLTGQKSANWNAMTNYKGSADYAKAVGYTGKIDVSSAAAIKRTNTAIQQDVMKRYPGIVDQFHNDQSYRMPNAGTPADGNLGVRWGAIGDEIQRRSWRPDKIDISLPEGQTIDPNFRPFTGGIQQQVGDYIPKVTTNTPNFTNGVSTTLSPNAWDTMGLLHAATRPIDHIRPQMFRTDAQISDPTFMDNRAQIQQIQSAGRTANDVNQNTANGQIARANSASTMGRLFDPINQSDGQTQNQNVQIENNWKVGRDSTMNQNAVNNLNALSKFVGENDMYRTNLSKEKQLKFTDTMLQGQNMTNNMLTLGSILAKTPNETVTGPFWNPTFKPNTQGTNLITGNNQSVGENANSLKAEYQSLFGGIEPTQAQLYTYWRDKRNRAKVITQGYDTIPKETEITSYQ